MAESNPSSFQQFFATLDPQSLILSQFSDSDKPNLLKLTTEGFLMERGPRYKAYAELRESKLRLKFLKDHPDIDITPPRKQVKVQGSLIGMGMITDRHRRKGSSSVLAQSVPDFSSALRKENRKPRSTMMPPLMEKSATPPLKSSSKMYGVGVKYDGSKSANASEKRGGGGMLMARKSFMGVDELKGLSSNVANAINGENRGGRKTILGYRQGY